MNAEELLKLFQTASEPDELLNAFEELLAAPEEATTLVTRQLAAFTAEPAKLAEESARKQLRCIFLLAGLLKRTEHFLPIFQLVCLPTFQEKVDKDDWLITELSRIFGLLSPAHCLDDLKAKTLDTTVPSPVMEQLALTIVFRWLAERDSDRDFQATIQELLEQLPAERITYDLGMALIIDAIAVGGEQLRTQVMDFYHANQDKLSAELPEKNLKQRPLPLRLWQEVQTLLRKITANVRGHAAPHPSANAPLPFFHSLWRLAKKSSPCPNCPPGGRRCAPPIGVLSSPTVSST